LSRMNNDECGTLAKQNPIIRSIEWIIAHN
jgi:hypothetical protein